MDTIVALMTPPGRSAAAVLRLSGDKARAIVEGMFTGKLENQRIIQEENDVI